MTEINEGLQGIQLHFVDNVATAMEFISWMGERRPHNAVSIDIETGEYPGRHRDDALSPWRGRIRLVQVGDGMQGWSIPWAEWAGVFYQAMKKYTGMVVFHNIAFEGKWFALQSEWDLPWERAHDTMLMAQVINPLGRAALKTLSSEMVDPQAANLQGGLDLAMRENGWTWGTIPTSFQAYWAYGALDTILTMRIFDKFWDKCAPGKEASLPYEIEMQTRKIANRMELNGAPVDLEYSQRKLDQIVQYTDRAKKWAKDSYGGLSITSNPQLARQFTSMGAEVTEFTPAGYPRIDKDQLKKWTITGNTEIKQLAQLVLDQRKQDKIASAYFSNFLSDNVDGILHPQIKTLAARTGRMSITDPALQTLPSGDPTVRHAFVPRDETHGIVSSDLDQVEFRLTAGLSRDQPLIDVFNEADRTGGDVFTTIMRQVYQDESLDKDRDKAKRKLIKGVVYGKLYGAGVDKMALTAGVLTEQMQQVVNSFDATYPAIKTFQKNIETTGLQRIRDEGVGYVTTATGRKLPCDSDRVYSLTNYLIQASAAEIFKQNLIKMDQADLTEYMVVPVHDEIVLSIPKDTEDTADIMQTIKECMTTTEGWPVPLTAGVDGPFENWGTAYEKKE
jgi:DNA polymerase-1